MKYSITNRAFLGSALLLLAMMSTNAAEVKLYKWVDTDGKISYQDRPPPVGQKYEEKSFTEQGADTRKDAEVKRSKAASANPVKLYIVQACESCGLVQTILDINKIPYDQIDIEADEEAHRELVRVSGSARVPTMTIGDEIISGFDRNKIEDTLKEQGYPVAKQVLQ